VKARVRQEGGSMDLSKMTSSTKALQDYAARIAKQFESTVPKYAKWVSP
jgi:hypothetical protein